LIVSGLSIFLTFIFICATSQLYIPRSQSKYINSILPAVKIQQDARHVKQSKTRQRQSFGCQGTAQDADQAAAETVERLLQITLVIDMALPGCVE
jgi:hypothetical protein